MAEVFARAYGMVVSSLGTMLTEETVKEVDLVVTMGCSLEEVFPVPLISLMAKKVVDCKIDDPRGRTIDDVRNIRTQIEEKVLSLFKKNN
jgi:protein-tyrosine-phosphatase